MRPGIGNSQRGRPWPTRQFIEVSSGVRESGEVVMDLARLQDFVEDNLLNRLFFLEEIKRKNGCQ
jgi:hypothetical protein